MKEPDGKNGNVADLLNNIYRCADKSSWYGNVTQAYDRTRPRYPVRLLEKMMEITGLQPKNKVLEIGAGPGIATIELAKLGLEVVALEPNLSACELARAKCDEYSQVKLVNTTFEAWDLQEQKFDAIVATTSFHWIEPEVRIQKTASALKRVGYLVLLWNTPPQPSDRILESLKSIYQIYTPKLTPPESIQNHQQSIGKFAAEMMDSGYYQDVISESLISQVTYSIDDYLTLLTTLSPYIGLSEELRKDLLAALKTKLQQNYGDKLQLSYLSMMQIGCLREK